MCTNNQVDTIQAIDFQVKDPSHILFWKILYPVELFMKNALSTQDNNLSYYLY